MFKSKPARIAIALQFALLGLPAAYAEVQPDASANLNATGEAAMERMVITAAGFEQKVVDAPASISVIRNTGGAGFCSAPNRRTATASTFSLG